MATCFKRSSRIHQLFFFLSSEYGNMLQVVLTNRPSWKEGLWIWVVLTNRYFLVVRSALWGVLICGVSLLWFRLRVMRVGLCCRVWETTSWNCEVWSQLSGRCTVSKTFLRLDRALQQWCLVSGSVATHWQQHEHQGFIKLSSLCPA